MPSGTRAYKSHLCAGGRGALDGIGEGGREDAVLHHGDDTCVPGRLFAVIPGVAHSAALFALMGNVFARFMVMLAAAPVTLALGVALLPSVGLCRAGGGWAWSG